MDIKEQTRNVAAQGRYGDSMLLHVNPAEVKGLSQALPITVNPQTGQPEAFLPFIAPFIGSSLGGMLATKIGAGALGAALLPAIGGGLATGLVEGDLKKGLLSGLTSFGIGQGLKGAAELAKGAESADAALNLAQTDATADAITGTDKIFGATGASESVGPQKTGFKPTANDVFTPANQIVAPTKIASPSDITSFKNQLAQGTANPAQQKIYDQSIASAKPAMQARVDMDVKNYLNSTPSFGKNLQTTFGVGDGKSFTPKKVFDGIGNLASGIASPTAAVPIAIGAGGAGILESEEEFAKQNQDRLNSYIAGRRQNFADNPEISLYTPNYSLSSPSFSASGGVTGYQEGGMTDYTNVAPDVPYIDNSLPIAAKQLLSTDQMRSVTGNAGVFAPARTLFDYNPNFQPGFSPETMYFDPNTINAPTIASQDGPPSLIDSYSGSAGGFDSLNLAQAPLSSIDPFQSYTGIAPQGIEKLSNITPSTLNPYENINTASMGNILSPTNVNAAQPVATTNTFMPNQPSASFNPAQPFVDTSIIAPPVNQPNLGQVVTAAGGGETLPNKGLEALNKVAPDVVEKMGYNEGGLTPPEAMMLQEMMPQEMMNEGIMSNPNNDPLVNQTVAFILGELDDQNIINQFIEKYGNEKFLSLRNEVLQSLVPNAQTEGLIAGNGNGGMDDDLRGTIGNQERIAVSQDEFIVPADVVSMLGDGSSEAGSNELYAMMDRVRKEKTGTTEQAPKLANAGGMLPG